MRIISKRVVELEEIAKEIERYLGHVYSSKKTSTDFKPYGIDPPVDIYETPQELIITVEIPGVILQTLEILLDDKNLKISGEKRSTIKSSATHFHQIEIYSGQFHKIIPLPVLVKAENVKASYNDGFLEIVLQKAVNPLMSKVIVIKL